MSILPIFLENDGHAIGFKLKKNEQGNDYLLPAFAYCPQPFVTTVLNFLISWSSPLQTTLVTSLLKLAELLCQTTYW